jgi:hypothetical protein
MTSQIDITKPVFGTPTTQSVRDNFTTAANEITILQNQMTGSPFLPLVGGHMTGAMYLFNDPTDAMMPATKGYVDAHTGSGGGGIPEAPSDGTYYGRRNGAWAGVLALAGGTLTGPLILAADPTNVLGAVTKQYADAIAASHLVDAPNDANTYGRHANAWTGVLPLTGGVLTGSLSLVGALPPTISTTLRTVAAGISIATAHTVNAYQDTGGTWRYLAAGTAGLIQTGTQQLYLYAAQSGAKDATISFVTAIQLDYLGDVIVTGGYAIPTDNARPAVSALTFITNTGNAGGGYNFNSYVSTGGTKVISGGYSGTIYQDDSGNLTFVNRPNTASGGAPSAGVTATLDQSGSWASNKLAATTGRIQCSNFGGTPSIYIWDTQAGWAGNMTIWAGGSAIQHAVSDGNGGSVGGAFFTTSAAGITIAGNGYKPGGGSWADSSDARGKDVKGDYLHGLAEVIQLHPVIYSYKTNSGSKFMLGGDGNDGTPMAMEVAKEFIGLIAQEAEMIMPELVTLTEGLVEGQPVSDFRTLEATALTFAFINSFKEVHARLRAGGL